MKRRSFIVRTSQTLAFALGGRMIHAFASSGQQRSQASPSALGQRVASLLEAFDAQGNHRTGTAVDNASAEWLAGQVRQLGIEPFHETFTLGRVDPQLACARLANRRIDGVPMFAPPFTHPEALSTRLAPLRRLS